MRILHVGYAFRPLRHGGVMFYAEGLMREQAAAGHDVTYFFAGRQLPVGPRDRLRRWSRDGIEMREILSSTLIFGGEGTLTPEDDLNHGPSETLFAQVVEEARPDVVHIHELIGLPSSLIDLARGRGVPVVATLQDYLPLCPVLKLYDVDDQLCLRPDVGEQCARCSAAAPEDRRWMVNATIQYELRGRLPHPWGARARSVLVRLEAARRRVRGLLPGPGSVPHPAPPRERAPSAASYQARRDLNVERLSRVDAAVVQSRRVAEIYARLGVEPSRIRVAQFTLPHIEDIAPKEIASPPEPVRFATLNGCASVQKGAEVVLGALERLTAAGLADRFELTVFGWIDEQTLRRLERFPSARYGGWYDPEGLDAVLEPFDVGIVPSVWEEAYGYVGPEFLAKGIPVIGNRRGGIVEYTRDGETGWVNEDASAAGLASIMAGIVERPGQVVELNAHIRRERSSILTRFAAHAGEIEGIYGQAIARAREREGALVAAAGGGPAP